MIVRGRVQGVGFRWACRDQAARLGVGGWVRNLADGSVEVAIEGEATSVDQLVEWCRRGPAPARVTGVEVHAEATRGDTTFAITS